MAARTKPPRARAPVVTALAARNLSPPPQLASIVQQVNPQVMALRRVLHVRPDSTRQLELYARIAPQDHFLMCKLLLVHHVSEERIKKMQDNQFAIQFLLVFFLMQLRALFLHRNASQGDILGQRLQPVRCARLASITQARDLLRAHLLMLEIMLLEQVQQNSLNVKRANTSLIPERPRV